GGSAGSITAPAASTCSRRPAVVEPTSAPAADTVPGILAWAERKHADTLAVVGPEGRRTFAELVAEVRAVAERLAEIGIGHGSRVAVYLGNGVRWVVSAL